MSIKTPKPEDILADDVNTLEKDGRILRKGSVAAALANAGVLASDAATKAEKAQALAILKELAPTLATLGMHEHVTWKNPIIQKMIEDAV